MKKTKETIDSIHLSLVSHTNIGKTTLARTLLGRDVGEIADRAHVTETTDSFSLAKTPTAELLLWDTPGFGNSIALAKRLEGRNNPIGWFASEVWDRIANRTQWLNQTAIKHVRDTSDIVLYLVNATELPKDTAYIAAEMRILVWIGKPVIVLLNQMGQPEGPKKEAEDIERWNEAMKEYPIVNDVLAMDAFARCWVQEISLLDAIGNALPYNLSNQFKELKAAWLHSRKKTYAASLKALIDYVDALLADREVIQTVTFAEQVRHIGQKLRKKSLDEKEAPLLVAQRALSERSARAQRQLTNTLIEVNALSGEGVLKEILSRLSKTDWSIKKRRFQPAKAALAGAVGGLAADLAAGGLTLGVGTLIGGVLGALGAAGIAVAYNTKRDAVEGTVLTWSETAIRNFTLEAILLYLAVAHYGRGRGKWIEGEYPAFWKPLVEKKLAAQKLDTDYLPLGIDAIIRAILKDLYPSSDF